MIILLTTYSDLSYCNSDLDENDGYNVTSNLVYFKDLINQASPMWFVEQPLLADAYRDYEFKSFDPIQKAYRNSSVRDLYINEEKYGFYGVDNTQSNVRLLPLKDLKSMPAMGANGYATISMSQVSDFPSMDYIKRSSDFGYNKSLE